MRAAQAQVGTADGPHADLVVGAGQERAERGGERRLAHGLQARLRSQHHLFGDVHLDESFRRDHLEIVGVRGVADIALPCQPSRSAENETPWPFSVRATIIAGPPAAIASVYAVSIAATSWPSISIVRQPYACARRANRSPFQPCIVGPRWPSRFMSRMATRSSTSWNAAASIASQTEPSEISESP